MIFNGVSKVFSLKNEQQYDNIGRFWGDMAEKHGLENLRGLGYKWQGDDFFYAIGLKDSDIPDYNVTISLPDEGWVTVRGKTDALKEMYDAIYQHGRLRYEIEAFNEDGTCEISYYR